jgi:predicted enzyme related to lactoylglutathione lyase
MSERTHYPSGVPCWVDTLQPDPVDASHFYSALFGWQVVGPGAMPGTPPGKYFVARLRGRDVAGIGSLPPQAPLPGAVWNTHLAVANADETCNRVTRAGGTVVVEPFDALPAGRLAVIRDSGGATFCAWEAKDRSGAQLVNEPAAWAMSALLTRDPEGAKHFYGDVFGWRTDTFDAGGTTVTLWRLPGYVGGEPQQPVPRDVVGVMLSPGEDALPPGAPPYWSVDFWVDDVDSAAAKASDLGGRVLAAPHDTPGFRQCTIADPQGAAFSLSQLTGIR